MREEIRGEKGLAFFENAVQYIETIYFNPSSIPFAFVPQSGRGEGEG
jgi:hypothetical protein